MNKKLMLTALVASCTLMASARPITKADARKIAAAFVTLDDATTDSGPVCPYYVFSKGPGRGYVIVSGDDTTAPILGHTEQGDYDYDLLPAPLKAMMDQWADRIAAIQSQNHVGARRTVAQRLAEARRGVAAYKEGWKTVDPLVKTHWHQDAPYNGLTPLKNGQHTMTGCVATAGSQVTYYFHKDNPDSLAYDTPTYSYGTPVTTSLPKGTPVRWDLMKLSGSGTSAQNHAVAVLMYALGTSAWLTYGEGNGMSTSGHNYKMADAMRGQFGLNSTHLDKSSFSQQAWEQRIYDNLSTRRPMLYSGVHPDNGGHSVVLDGYSAATGLFHFNFGWGGQGDGWYTVDDATGMNGFNSYQDLVCDITPQKPNVQVEMSQPTVYHRAPSTVSVQVANDGTLDFSGLYLYINTSPKLPSSQIATDTKTIVASGASATVDISFVATLQSSKYLFVCDKSKRILDSCRISVSPTKSALTVGRLSADAGTEQTVADGISYKTVNNTTARIAVSLTNGEGGTYCRPSLECFLDAYDQQQQAWKRLQTAKITTMTFDEGQQRDTVFVFANLTPGTLYRASLNPKAYTSTEDDIAFATTDSMAYFTVRQPDFSVERTGRLATLSGLWDATLFGQLSADGSICAYDISRLQQVDGRLLRAANANALFYSDTERPELADVPNVVCGDQCRQLRLRSGHDFKPIAPFTAHSATYTIAHAEAGQWTGTLIPFATDVPLGMQMKQPTSAKGNNVYHTHTLQVEAMTPVVMLISHGSAIEATSVAVTTDTLFTFFDGMLTASTLERTAQDGWLLPGDYRGMPYFLPADAQAGAFIPVVHKSVSRSATTTEADADIAYRDLSLAISEAYATLSPQATEQATGQLTESIGQAEHMLTYRTTTAKADITAQIDALRQAVALYQADLATGIRQPAACTASEPKAAYYTLSGVRTSQPRRGIVLMRLGSKTRKILIK